ncbi:DUF5133 domain-containing protein [Streptomyces sp. NPDC001661]
MLTDPTVLRDLVEQYGRLEELTTQGGTPEDIRDFEDVSYTLCVSTGTRDVKSALKAARKQLGEASGEQQLYRPQT